MDTPLPTGKLPAALLAELLTGAGNAPEVRIGPRVGEDACAIDVPAGTLVAATDPITLTGSGVGAHAVRINANDVAVMGVRPRWFMAVVLMPKDTPVAAVRALFEEQECRPFAISAVTGEGVDGLVGEMWKLIERDRRERARTEEAREDDWT